MPRIIASAVMIHRPQPGHSGGEGGVAGVGFMILAIVVGANVIIRIELAVATPMHMISRRSSSAR